jgi:hypothetical protein
LIVFWAKRTIDGESPMFISLKFMTVEVISSSRRCEHHVID